MLSHVRLIVTPWTAAHQAPPSMGLFRQEHWSGVPLPSPLIPACPIKYPIGTLIGNALNHSMAAAMVHIVRPRGANPCLRLGAEAGRTPCPRGGGQEELPHVRGQGQRPRVPGCNSAGAAKRSYPPPQARGGGRGGDTLRPRSGGYAGAGGPETIIKSPK